jgi:hypothetical protein
MDIFTTKIKELELKLFETSKIMIERLADLNKKQPTFLLSNSTCQTDDFAGGNRYVE